MSDGAPPKQLVEIDASLDGARLDAAIQRAFGRHSRKTARQAIIAGTVRLNGKIVKILARTVKTGDRLVIDAAAEHPAKVEYLEAKVLFSDRDLLIVDKPAGLLSERVPWESGAAIQDVLRDEFGATHLVHRLDAGTSGVMMLARTEQAATALSDAFRNGQVEKSYLLLCAGVPGAGEFTGALGRDNQHARRFCVRPDGKHARTRYLTVKSEAGFALANARPETGRTHQIRVHFAHGGHPLLGDRLYAGKTKVEHGGKIALVSRPMLHAFALAFAHPRTQKPLRYVVRPPEDFQTLTETLALTTDFDALDPLW